MPTLGMFDIHFFGNIFPECLSASQRKFGRYFRVTKSREEMRLESEITEMSCQLESESNEMSCQLESEINEMSCQ